MVSYPEWHHYALRNTLLTLSFSKGMTGAICNEIAVKRYNYRMKRKFM